MLNSLAYFSIYACFAFSLLGLLGEVEATRQMGRSRYLFVPVIRLLRHARIGAAAMVALFLGVSFAASPLAALPALLMTWLFTLSIQHKALFCGAYWDAALRTTLPSALVLCFAFDLVAAAAPNVSTGLSLGMVHAALVGGSAVCLWLIAEFRVQQDLIRLRD